MPMRDTTGNVTTVDVTLRLADTVPSQAFAVRIPLTVFSHTGIADRLHDLRMSDSKGDVAVTVADEGANRIWRAGRAVEWPVVVHYTAVVPPSRSVAGPPIDLRTFAGRLTRTRISHFRPTIVRIGPPSLGSQHARKRFHR
jgi:hypothetical protein